MHAKEAKFHLALREVVLRGIAELSWQQVVAMTIFLLALGALLRFGDLRSTAPVDEESPER